MVSSVIVLEESYYHVKGIIMKAESKSETVAMNHENFKRELQKLPKKVHTI